MPASAILRNIPLAVLTNSNITPVFWSTRWWSTTRISGASTSPGVKRCGIIAWREITFATTRNLRWSWHEITRGLCLRQTKVCRATCKTARWCPAFSNPMNGGWIWWLSSVNGNTSLAGPVCAGWNAAWNSPPACSVAATAAWTSGGKRRLMIEIKVMHPAGHA